MFKISVKLGSTETTTYYSTIVPSLQDNIMIDTSLYTVTERTFFPNSPNYVIITIEKS